MPSISFIIPTYNRATIISRTLDSVLAQTFMDWECLVVDDFSTDNTKEIVDSYCTKDTRFQYFVNEGKKGAQGARNTGVKYAQGEWIQFFDSDDIMHADLLESMFCTMREDNTHSDVYTCFSNVINYKTKDIVDTFKWICEGDIRKKILCGEVYVDYNGAIIRKQKIIDIGGLDEDCPSMQEWDTHIRLSKIAKYHTNPKILIDYHIGGTDTISSDMKREVIGDVYLLNKHKKDWSIYKSSYWMYGERVIDLLNGINDTSFRKEYREKVFALMPGLRKHLFMNKKKQQYKTIRHKIAIIINPLKKNDRTIQS